MKSAIDFEHPEKYLPELARKNFDGRMIRFDLEHGRFMGRFRTRDNFMTFDSRPTHDSAGNAMGLPLTQADGRRMNLQFKTSDGGTRTVDSTGAFLVGELERLDLTLHKPLASVTWGRDIDLREDVTLADEVSSFTLSQYGAVGMSGNGIQTGKAWVGKTTNQIQGLSVDIAKIPYPLNLWAMELAYTIPELASAARLGRPIDEQKYQGLQLKHQMDIDEMVYVGDTTINQPGMLSMPSSSGIVNVTNVSNVATSESATTWAAKLALSSGKGPDYILTDFNEVLASVWAASAWARIPNRVLIPPAQYGLISTAKVSTAGNVSVLKYITENNILTTSGRGKLEILPSKWCIGAGVGGTLGTVGNDRMMVYTKDKELIRYPMTLLQRTPVQYDSLFHKTTYFCRLGVVEIVYPETVGYRDGL